MPIAVLLRPRLAVALVCFATTMLVVALPGTANQSDPAADVPEISDQPQTIDPARFLPEALAREATVDLADGSLHELVSWLTESQNLVVLVEEEALADVGVFPGDPLSDHLVEAPVYLLLNRLRSLGVAWLVEDDLVRITSEAKAQAQMVTVPYNVGHLLDADYEADNLAYVVTGSIDPSSWEVGGGTGAVSMLGDVMFVRQTHARQRQVAGLLAALQEHGRRTWVLDPPRHQPLREALAREVSVDFRNTPLAGAVQALSGQNHIDLRLDRPALERAGIRERQPVSLTLRDRPLETVLQAMLLDLELTWVLRNGVLWVTTQSEASGVYQTAVYDVRDLCRDRQESDALVDAILSQTDAVWEEVGGDSQLLFARPGTLVVRSTETMQDDVLELLETYREALRMSKPRKRQQDDPDEVITVYYRLHTPVAQDLAGLLPRLVQPDTWRMFGQLGGGGPIGLFGRRGGDEQVGTIAVVRSTPEILPGNENLPEGHADRSVLIIRHTRATHEEIREVIRRVEQGDAVQGQGLSGGGMGGFGGGYFAVPE